MSKEMSVEEADRIIAEFMGFDLVNMDYSYKDYPCEAVWENQETGAMEQTPFYSQSLDALVPVWEKLRIRAIQFNFWKKDPMVTILRGELSSNSLVGFNNKNLEQAAAIATVKAILEMEKEG